MSPSPPGWVIPERYWRWIATRRTARVVLWLLCLVYAGQRLYHARTEFADNPAEPADRRRADGNVGHAQIDFGGQWVMARMLVTGHGRELYHREVQWPLVWESFPPSRESEYQRRHAAAGAARDPDTHGEVIKHDAESLMYSFMGKDPGDRRDRPDDSLTRREEAFAAATLPLAAGSPYPNPFAAAALIVESRRRLTPDVVEELSRPAIGGPLYPPVHPFLYAPLGTIDDPQTAYYLFQFVTVGLTFVAGLGVSRLSRGRIWWPAATLVILLYPGYRSGLDLAQNHVLTLTIVVWGWVCATRGRDGIGGVVWGLLAFKPVWAAAFLLVPLLMRRWRFCAAMALTGAGLCAATLPVVGLQAWFDWLAVGREASAVYSVNKNWIGLSRDLSGIPRRLLIDFDAPEAERRNATAEWLGWVVWGAVFVPTVGLYLWGADKRYRTGLGAGFLFLGAYLCCYRFMYYDVLLSVLPLAVLFADPGRFLRPSVFELWTAPASGSQLPAAGPTPADPLRPRWVGYVNSLPLTVLALMLLVENWLLHLGLDATFGIGYFANTSTTPGGTERHVPRLSAELGLFQAWETLLLLLIWAWCGLRLLAGPDWGEPAQAKTPRSASSAAPTSGDRIKDSPTSTA